MATFFDAAAESRLASYFNEIGYVLGDERRRASFATYAMGLVGDGERKSLEPIAARACGNPDDAERAHDRLHHCLTDSPWSDAEVRLLAARYAISAMTARETIVSWIVDDTGFLKQGKHSVGVQRQYTGSAGKTANCQIGVSLSVATPTEHVPIDFELYLPECWANDPKKRKEGRIPDDIPFRTKPELALAMMRRAIANGIPPGIFLGDSAYGNSSDFRLQTRQLGLHYAVGVHSTTNVWRVDRLDRRRGEPVSVKELAIQLARKKRKYRRVTWRQGTGGPLASRFAMTRVVPAHEDGVDASKREVIWLVIEWPDGKPEPDDYFFVSIDSRLTHKKMVRIIKERYRTERVYEDLKGELGLDHYEGRRFSGWHHHISAVLCCYSFIIAERVRHFPPSARRETQADAQLLAA